MYAQQLHDRHLGGFAAQVPKRNVDGADCPQSRPAPPRLDRLAEHFRPQMLGVKHAGAQQHGTVNRIHQLDHRLAAVIGKGKADAFKAAGANLHDQMIAMSMGANGVGNRRLQWNGNSNRLNLFDLHSDVS